MHPEEIIDHGLSLSRYAQRVLESEPDLRAQLSARMDYPFLAEEMQAFLDDMPDVRHSETALHAALRRLRKQVMLRLIMRDLAGKADLQEVMASMTALAEVTVNFSLMHHYTWLADPLRYGVPVGATSHKPQSLMVVAMGKLGGNELNVSSDVDLIFIYPEEGETNGARSVSNQDFFSRLGKKLIASLNEMTSDGYVFRVDMRLRPYGESGPLVMDFAMLEAYFVSQGREWERYAWIKSRVITHTQPEQALLLERMAQSFVFRSYLDFGAYESMRNLYTQIRQEVNRREMHQNIKLGPGGIREIEFIAQVFQLIRGGREVVLRIRPTLSVLHCLQEKHHLPADMVAELAAAYQFLRKLEHRLQYLDDRQTQELPVDPADQALIARAMGYPDYAGFMQQLDSYRSTVTQHFESVLSLPQKSDMQDTLSWLWQERSDQTAGNRDMSRHLGTLGFASPDGILERLQVFRKGARYRQLAEPDRQRVDTLIPMLVEVAARSPAADTTLELLLQLLESISRRSTYLSLLLEHPEALERVARLSAISQWASKYLARHPVLLDELLAPVDPDTRPDQATASRELALQLESAVNSAGAEDTEQRMDILRHFHHARVFRLLVQDLDNRLPLEKLSDHLTDLADLILGQVLQQAWSGLRKKHRTEPAFSVIGYGKLGGKELGYVSDLDIIFLYDDPHPDAQEIYARLGQRINSWLTSYTSAGLLYETDFRLRPNGSGGLLVSSVEAFMEYQQNQAWVWEHQALTRARFVTGDRGIGEQFERIRKQILCRRRVLPDLRHDILVMRQKMQEAHPNATRLFDIKHDRGGIIDVEFIVQYLVLGYAADYPELTGNIGNIALLKLAGELGLVSSRRAGAVSDIYREFRRIQHRLRLSGTQDADTLPVQGGSQMFSRVDGADFAAARSEVLELWNEAFGI